MAIKEVRRGQKRRIAPKSSIECKQEEDKKKKRVSFANSLEESSSYGQNGETKEEIGISEMVDAKPQKGILKKWLAAGSGAKGAESGKTIEQTNFSVAQQDRKEHHAHSENQKNIESKQRGKQQNRKGVVPSMKRTMPFNKKRTIKVTRSTKEILMRMDKKQRREFIRELEAKNKPNFELGRTAILLWEQIRSAKTAKDEKEKAIQDLLALCRGKFSKLIYSHATCRVVQCLVALNRPEIREVVFEELKTEIIEMAKSKYAKYFVSKMLKYGSKEQRDVVINAFIGHSVELYRIAHAAGLLEKVYNEWATAEQRYSIVTEFYGNEFALFKRECNLPPSQWGINGFRDTHPEKLDSILQILEKAIEKAVQKVPMLKLSLTHKLLLDYLLICSSEQRQSIIDSLKDQLPEICHSAEGSRAALLCIWHANVKERKAIVKSFKGLALRTCQDQFARRALFGIFDTVDDTTLVNKIFTKEIADNIADVLYNKNGVWTLHYLVHPRDHRVIGKGLFDLLKQADLNPHTKKAPGQRYAELFECVREPLLTFIVANMREVITNKISAVLVLDTLEVPSPSDPFQREIPDDHLDGCFRAIAEIAADEFIPHSPDGPSHIVQSGCARFVFRKLLQGDHQRQEGHKISDFLAEIPAESLASWTGMDCGCYALVEMYKSGSEKAREALKQAISLSSLQNSHLAGSKALLDQFTGVCTAQSSTIHAGDAQNRKQKRHFQQN